jgi:hypothetical protein
MHLRTCRGDRLLAFGGTFAMLASLQQGLAICRQAIQSRAKCTDTIPIHPGPPGGGEDDRLNLLQ